MAETRNLQACITLSHDQELRDCSENAGSGTTPRHIDSAEEHLPPEGQSRYLLGINFVASNVLFRLFSKDDPMKVFLVNVIDICVSGGPGGRLFTGPRLGPTTIPSARALFGRKFHDPSVKPSLKNYPLRIFEHRESGACTIHIADRIVMSPEVGTATMLPPVRQVAERIAASPGVPIFFTRAERALVRDAAESVGFRVGRIASGTILSLQAMTASNEFNELGNSVIVDI
jgi:hypothetical protein